MRAYVFCTLTFVKHRMGKHTSTAALRVAFGDEMGTRRLEYNRATLSLGTLNAETWSSALEVGLKAGEFAL
jgi:hypothetical protein